VFALDCAYPAIPHALVLGLIGSPIARRSRALCTAVDRAEAVEIAPQVARAWRLVVVAEFIEAEDPWDPLPARCSFLASLARRAEGGAHRRPD
jgi:hypothetical protein